MSTRMIRAHWKSIAAAATDAADMVTAGMDLNAMEDTITDLREELAAVETLLTKLGNERALMCAKGQHDFDSAENLDGGRCRTCGERRG